MDSLREVYQQQISHNLKYFAIWEPNKTIQVGDYGILQNGNFQAISSLAKKDVRFYLKEEPTKGSLEYASAGTSNIDVLGDGNIEDNYLGFEISFSKEKSVYFKASDTKNYSIDDLEKLESSLKKLLALDQWNIDYVVVTEVIKAEQTTAIVSNDKDGVIKVKSKLRLDQLTAVKTSINAEIKITNRKNIGIAIIGEKNLTPLFKLTRLRRGFITKAALDNNFYRSKSRSEFFDPMEDIVGMGQKYKTTEELFLEEMETD